MGENKFHTPTGNRDKEMLFELVEEVICTTSKLAKCLLVFINGLYLETGVSKLKKLPLRNKPRDLLGNGLLGWLTLVICVQGLLRGQLSLSQVFLLLHVLYLCGI